MSESTPAASKAAFSSGRSLFSRRAEDAVSGRITPTLALAAGVAVAVAALELPLLAEPELSSLPQPATTVIAAAASNIGTSRLARVMWSPPPKTNLTRARDYLCLHVTIMNGNRLCERTSRSRDCEPLHSLPHLVIRRTVDRKSTLLQSRR